jgi:G:T-mismatch repair DNA endonuclease (very short patch repair protein)
MKLTKKMKEWLMINDKEWPIKCKMCYNDVKWQASHGRFSTYCCSICYHADTEVFDVRRLTNLDRYGTESPLSSPIIREKIKATNLDRYGHENIAQGTKKEKVTVTNMERYGTKSPLSSPIIRDKQRATNLERHGHESPFGSDVVKSKVASTNLERYGHNNALSSPGIREKVKSTNLERYGTEFAGQKDIVDALPLLLDSHWLFDQYISQNKPSTQIAYELGDVYYGTIISHLRKAGIEIRNTCTSYAANQWLDSLGITEREYQWHPTNTRLRSDGYCPITNTIYEFHGDYWHGNPANQDQAKIFHGDVTLGDKYRNTKLREEEILALGYNLVVMWENDWRNITHRAVDVQPSAILSTNTSSLKTRETHEN